MKRFTSKLPGHDCVRHPCGLRGCGTHPGSNHGVASETWIYAVSDGEVALSLRVSSDVYPKSVPKRSLPDCGAQGWVFHEHHAFPICEEHVLSEPEECEYLDAGACYSTDSSYIDADEFFGHFGTSQFEQPPSFWIQLEFELQSRAARLQKERVDKTLSRCNRCNGTGIIRHDDQ